MDSLKHNREITWIKKLFSRASVAWISPGRLLQILSHWTVKRKKKKVIQVYSVRATNTYFAMCAMDTLGWRGLVCCE